MDAVLPPLVGSCPEFTASLVPGRKADYLPAYFRKATGVTLIFRTQIHIEIDVKVCAQINLKISRFYVPPSNEIGVLTGSKKRVRSQ